MCWIGDGQTYSAIESRVNLVKSSVTWIFSCGPNLAHFTTNWLAISCISSNIDRIDSGPNATLQSAIDSQSQELCNNTGHQHTMCNLPVVFSCVCRKETIFYPISDLLQCSCNGLRKTLLVADFVKQFMAGYKELRFAADIKFKNRT